MKFQQPKDKYEALFHGFYLLFDPAANADQQDEICKLLTLMLADPEITIVHAQQATERAIDAHSKRKKIGGNFQCTEINGNEM